MRFRSKNSRLSGATACFVMLLAIGAGDAVAKVYPNFGTYSYNNASCSPGFKGTNRLDPVSVLIYSTSSSAITTDAVANATRGGTNPGGSKFERLFWLKDRKPLGEPQYSTYFSGSTRVCAKYDHQNMTDETWSSRYHVRWFRGGKSTDIESSVTGTPHYDEICRLHHEIRTFQGGRTALLAMFPSATYPRRRIYVGNTNRRFFNCLGKQSYNDGYVYTVKVP